MEDRIGARVAASHHIIAPRSPRAVLHPCIPALYHRQPRRIEEERSKNSGPHRTVVNSTRASVEGNIYEGKLRRLARETIRKHRWWWVPRQPGSTRGNTFHATSRPSASARLVSPYISTAPYRRVDGIQTFMSVESHGKMSPGAASRSSGPPLFSFSLSLSLFLIHYRKI